MPPVFGTNLIDTPPAPDDPHRPSNGIHHDFQEIVIAICAKLSDVDNFDKIASWRRLKVDWLKRLLTLKKGVPSHDTIERVFRLLDPERSEVLFRQCVGEIVTALGGRMVIVGKTRSGSADGNELLTHRASAFATGLGSLLGQQKIAEKGNGITAIPVLLDTLYVKGCLISSDAMSCLSATIIAKGGDYLLMVKGNQPSLLNAIETTFISQYDAEGVDRQSHAETSHRPIVGRVASVLPAKGTVDLTDWPKCKTIGRIDSIRAIGEKESGLERRYYISSRDLSSDQLAAAVRAHWAIENRPHWVPDVSFGEDACQTRKNNAPESLPLLKRILLNPTQVRKPCYGPPVDILLTAASLD